MSRTSWVIPNADACASIEPLLAGTISTTHTQHDYLPISIRPCRQCGDRPVTLRPDRLGCGRVSDDLRKAKRLPDDILPPRGRLSVTEVTLRHIETGKGRRSRWQASGLSCGLGPAHHLAFITSRMRSKSSREEYSIRILPLPLRSVMVTRTPSARCSFCSASLTFGSTMRTFSTVSGG